MRVQFAKWGNSIAVRIPAAFARELSAVEGSSAEMVLEEGKLVISPVDEPAYSLTDLVGMITDGNRHGEADAGPSVGAEFRW